jgi:hypothetical protein
LKSYADLKPRQTTEAQDLRIHGVSFETAVKRMIATPPPPTSKKAKLQKAADSAVKKKSRKK